MTYLSFRSKYNAISCGFYIGVCLISALSHATFLLSFSFFMTMISWYSASFFIQRDFERFIIEQVKENNNALRD